MNKCLNDFLKRYEEPVYARWHTNEILRPASYGVYLIVLTVIGIYLVMTVLIMPVSAMTITMSQPGSLSERDVIVYFPNQTMQGFYNSSSVIDLDANTSYIFVLKPLSSNPLEDPSDWLVNSAFPFLQTNVIALVVSFALIGLFFARWK
jgi:hypothetical protein